MRRQRARMRTSTSRGEPSPKQRVTHVLRRSDCERKSAELRQRSPTSTRPSRGAAASNVAGARRSLHAQGMTRVRVSLAPRTQPWRQARATQTHEATREHRDSAAR